MTSKNPEQIMEEFVSKRDIFNTITREEIDWLRSSLASVLLWASEQVKLEECSWTTEDYSKMHENISNKFRSLLIEKAKEITKE